MFKVFNGPTADNVWQKAANEFRKGHNVSYQDSRAGGTFEIMRASFSIENPRQRWIGSRRPAINPAFAIAEIVWILTGRNDSAFLNYFNSQLKNYAGSGKTYHGAYGYRIRARSKIDQLERAYQVLKKNPDSRQVVLQIWDALADLPKPNGKPASPDIPCNLLSLLKVRNKSLEWTQIMRSNDLFRGVPHNVIQFTTIQEVLAGWLGLDLGSYNHFSDSLHVYKNELEHIQSSKPIVVPPNSDSISFPKKESEKLFLKMGSLIDNLVQPNLSHSQLFKLWKHTKFPSSMRNMACIMCAESARRRKYHELEHEIMSFCGNPLYIWLFSRWQARCNGLST